MELQNTVGEAGEERTLLQAAAVETSRSENNALRAQLRGKRTLHSLPLSRLPGSTLLYSSLLFPTLLYSTLLYSSLLFSTLL